MKFISSLNKALPYIPVISTGWGIYTLANSNLNQEKKTNKIAALVFSNYDWFPKDQKKANQKINQIRAWPALIPVVGNLIVGAIDLFCYFNHKKSTITPVNNSISAKEPDEREKKSDEEALNKTSNRKDVKEKKEGLSLPQKSEGQKLDKEALKKPSNKEDVKDEREKKSDGEALNKTSNKDDVKEKRKSFSLPQKSEGQKLYLEALIKLSNKEDVKKEEALSLLQKAVDAEYVPAMVKLACMNLFDRAVEQTEDSDKEAAILLQKAYEMGDRSAPIYLSRLYQKGIGVEEDFRKAKELLEEAIKNGNERAFTHLGTLYEQEAREIRLLLLFTKNHLDNLGPPNLSNFTPLNEEEQSLTISLDTFIKKPKEKLEREVQKLTKKQESLTKQALELFEQRAKAGDVKSMVRFAIIFVGDEPLKTPSDEERRQVVDWLNTAIKKGIPGDDLYHRYCTGKAKYLLGKIYEEGWEIIGGNTQDNKLIAKNLFEEATDLGLLTGRELANIGLMGAPRSSDILEDRLKIKRIIR